MYVVFSLKGKKITLQHLEFCGRSSDEPLSKKKEKKLVFCTDIIDDVEHIKRHLCPYRWFVREFFVKGFRTKKAWSTEQRHLDSANKTNCNHLFPWVSLHKPIRGRVVDKGGSYDGKAIFLLITEYINADNILKHFSELINANLDYRLILYKYCETFIQVLNALHTLHARKLYHCDIKSDNILFENNLLKIIDFGGARVFGRIGIYGTVRYLPSYALRASIKHKNISNMSIADLHLAIMTFLEVFTLFDNVLVNDIIIGEIKQLLNSKVLILQKASEERISGKKKATYALLLEQQYRLEALLADWYKKQPKSALARLFSTLLIQPDCKDAEAQWESIQPTTEALYKSLLSSVQNKFKTTSFDDADFFQKNMEQLQTCITSSLFSAYYPLIYLHYSTCHHWYDKPAEYAAKRVAALLGKKTVGSLSSMDMGAAFGTSAYWMATKRFKMIHCMDNNPSFQRLADLLWSEVDPIV